MRPHLRAVIQALFVVFLWATSWVLIKIGLEEIPALTFAGLRYTLAFVCLLPVVLFSRRAVSFRSLTRQSWVQLLGLGILLYTLTQGTMFVALAYLPAVTVNLLWSFSSVVVALMGIAWLAERLTGFQWLGVSLTILGVILYFYPVEIPVGQHIGLLAAAIGILANAGAAILGRKINRSGEITPLVVTLISMGVGSLALLVTGILVQGLPSISLAGWGIIVWLSLVNTAFAFTLWNHTLRTLSATESSIINGTMLIWIPVLAVLFLGEQVSIKEALGLIVVAVGTLIVQLRRPWFPSLLPKPAVTLREFQETDLPLLDEGARRIRSGNFMSRYRPANQSLMAHDPANGLLWYVVRVGGSDTGTIWLEPGSQPDEAILGIYLWQESLCGRGIGQKAIDLVIQKALELDAFDKISLHVRQSNPRAIACYQKCGFEPVATGIKHLADGEKYLYITMELHLGLRQSQLENS